MFSFLGLHLRRSDIPRGRRGLESTLIHGWARVVFSSSQDLRMWRYYGSGAWVMFFFTLDLRHMGTLYDGANSTPIQGGPPVTFFLPLNLRIRR